MAELITMTQLSPTMQEGILVSWEKQEGEVVAPGDIIASVETDKAVMNLEAYDEGILLKHLVKIKSRIKVGSPIAIVGEKSEDISALLAKVTSLDNISKASSIQSKNIPTTSQKETLSDSFPSQATLKEDSTIQDNARIKASPLAKKLATQENISMNNIQGTGPMGRILKRDVVKYQTSSTAVSMYTGQSQTSPFFPSYPNDLQQPVSMMNHTIAQRLTLSKSQIPHFYLEREIDLTSLIKMRQKINNSLQQCSEDMAEDEYKMVKVSINDFIIMATAFALAKNRIINAEWQNDTILLKKNIDIGVAVALDDGLITPIIRSAEQKTIFNIATEVKQLAQKARKRTLQPEEYTNSTFTISNLGMFGIQSFSAIINPPEVAILAVGAVSKKLRWDKTQEEFISRDIISITLSCDHRVVNGMVGAKFLQSLAFFLENSHLLR